MLKSTLGAEKEGRIYPAQHTGIAEERSARLLVVCTLLTRDLWEERPSVSSSRRNISCLALQEAGAVHMFKGRGGAALLLWEKQSFP